MKSFSSLFHFLYICSGCLLFTSLTWADCGLSVTTSNVSINWNLNFATLAVEIKVDKANNPICNFGIGISKGGAADYASRRGITGSKEITYQIYKDNGLSQVVKDLPDITSGGDVITSGFPVGTGLTQTLLYYFSIPYAAATSPTLVGSGTYTDTYVIHVYEGADPMAFTTPVVSTTVNVSIQVPPMIALSLIDSGGSFQSGNTSRNINFGTLAQGQSSSFDLRVRSNAGYSVSFSSANNGKLHHTTPAKNSTVPYRLYVNSTLLDLSSSATIPAVGLSGAGQTSLSGLAYPIQVVIGSLSGSILGGPHADEITITATTTE